MNFLEDPLTGQTRSIQKCRDSLHIPMDLVIEIFSRLPAKSVAKFICLSKFWANVIRSQYFVDLFLVKSSARPQILFGRRNNPKFSFFSADQPSENSSDNIIAPTLVTDYPISNNDHCQLGVPINGLVCLSEYVGEMRVPVIHNPTTREFLTLPKMKTRWRRQDLFIRNLLGYDPNEKHFKVLSLVCDTVETDINSFFVEYQVLTLETKALMSWRIIECCTPHSPPFHHREICINGILYYQTFGVSMVQLIVCFDVRSETFNVIETSNKKLPVTATLTDYNGKLGLLIPEESRPILSGESKSFELWVLKNAEKKQWSKHVFVLPHIWKNVVRESKLFFVGMIGTNKVVLSCFRTNETPYIFSYNIRKNTIRRINIQGMEASSARIYDYVFLNHVENLMSLFKFLK